MNWRYLTGRYYRWKFPSCMPLAAGKTSTSSSRWRFALAMVWLVCAGRRQRLGRNGWQQWNSGGQYHIPGGQVGQALSLTAAVVTGLTSENRPIYKLQNFTIEAWVKRGSTPRFT